MYLYYKGQIGKPYRWRDCDECMPMMFDEQGKNSRLDGQRLRQKVMRLVRKRFENTCMNKLIKFPKKKICFLWKWSSTSFLFRKDC